MDDGDAEMRCRGDGRGAIGRVRPAGITILTVVVVLGIGALAVAGCARVPARIATPRADALPQELWLPDGCEYKALSQDGRWLVAWCSPGGPTAATSAGLWAGAASGNEWHELAPARDLTEGEPAFAQWSPDGSMLVWGQTRGALTLVRPGTWSEKQVLHPRAMGFQGRPKWAPDSSELAIAGVEAGSALALVRPDGSSRVLVADEEVTQPPDVDFGPTWSPDGRRLAYLGLPDEGDATDRQLWLVDAVTGEQQLVLDTGEPVAEPAWSPDGLTVALLRPWDALFVFDVRSKTLTAVPLPAGVTEVQGQVWSPDSSRLAVETHTGVLVVSFRGGAPMRLTSEPANIVRWAEDGRGLLVRRRVGNRDAIDLVRVGGER